MVHLSFPSNWESSWWVFDLHISRSIMDGATVCCLDGTEMWKSIFHNIPSMEWENTDGSYKQENGEELKSSKKTC